MTSFFDFIFENIEVVLFSVSGISSHNFGGNDEILSVPKKTVSFLNYSPLKCERFMASS